MHIKYGILDSLLMQTSLLDHFLTENLKGIVHSKM